MNTFDNDLQQIETKLKATYNLIGIYNVIKTHGLTPVLANYIRTDLNTIGICIPLEVSNVPQYTTEALEGLGTAISNAFIAIINWLKYN